MLLYFTLLIGRGDVEGALDVHVDGGALPVGRHGEMFSVPAGGARQEAERLGDLKNFPDTGKWVPRPLAGALLKREAAAASGPQPPEGAPTRQERPRAHLLLTTATYFEKHGPKPPPAAAKLPGKPASLRHVLLNKAGICLLSSS